MTRNVKNGSKKIDENMANCTLCNKNFTIKYEGFLTVKKHLETNDHISNSKTRSKQNAINNFFIKRDSNEENKVISTEVAFIYHSIRHNNSYLSMECGMKISPKLFPDSKISKKVSCARTKSEAIAKNVLSPFSIEKHLKEIINKKFSISIDVSNKKNIKLFPVVIQYFNIEEDLKSFVLDFYEDHDECSEVIFNNINTVFKEYNLDVNSIGAYSADNTSVNYGIHKSVFKSLNTKIIQ